MKGEIRIVFFLLLFGFALTTCKKGDNKLLLISPPNGAKLNIDNLNFAWQPSNTSRYFIEIASDNAFSNIVDSVIVDSTKYHAIQLPAGTFVPPYYVVTSPNYIMGETYFWRVISLAPSTVNSETRSFIINDPRNSFTGQWTGRFHYTSFVEPNHSTDTSYNGSVSIVSNSDGTISVGGYIGLFPFSNTYYAFGYVIAYGSHSGATCIFDSTFHKLIFAYGTGGMGGGLSR